MSFIKNGDAQPIVVIQNPALDDDDDMAKKALEAAKQRAKNIKEVPGNKTEFTIGSNS